MLNKLGISLFEFATYVAILILLSIVIILFCFFPDLLWEAVQEDAIFENLTVFFLLVCLSICLFKVYVHMKAVRYRAVLTFSFLSLVILFVAGEEISWGQRIFNIQSGEFFMQNNTQNETNLHNLQIGDIRINKLVFTQLSTLFFALYFLFSRLLCRKFNVLKKIIESFCIPLPKLHHTIFFYFAFLTVYAFDYKRNNEVMELIFPLIYIIIFLYPYKCQTIKKDEIGE